MTRMWRRAMAVVSLAAGAVASFGGTAQAAVASHPSGAAPQPWMIIAGLATVPIALLALAAMLRKMPDDEEQDRSQDEPCSPGSKRR